MYLPGLYHHFGKHVTRWSNQSVGWNSVVTDSRHLSCGRDGHNCISEEVSGNQRALEPFSHTQGREDWWLGELEGQALQRELLVAYKMQSLPQRHQRGGSPSPPAFPWPPGPSLTWESPQPHLRSSRRFLWPPAPGSNRSFFMYSGWLFREPALGGPACCLQPPPTVIGCCPCGPGAGGFPLSLMHVLRQPPLSTSVTPSLCVPCTALLTLFSLSVSSQNL